MILEILFAPKRGENLVVFGAHIFILDNNGENAFSFLLNSHHEIFAGAKLYAENPNEEGVKQLEMKCIKVCSEAFAQQIDVNNQ